MLILGIETSCDETAVAVLEVKNQKAKIKSSVVSSQVKLHAPYGGVVPHLAAREHEKNLPVVLAQALKAAKVKMEKIDLIAVTAGPGLSPALWRGVNFANALAEKENKLLIAVNHIEGHIYSNWLKSVRINYKLEAKSNNLFPALCLIVSGGHTQLILMSGYGKYKLIGETVDDAAGEAFDKIARILKLGYPGGPVISKTASRGDAAKFSLPRPMLYSKDYNFSFAGLKTAVLYLVRSLKKVGKQTVADIAASAQAAIVDVLIAKTMRAAREYKVKTVMLSGGVSANKLLRENLTAAGKGSGLPVLVPPLEYTGDNAVMIALAGYFQSVKLKTKSVKLGWQKVKADANWELC